MSKYLYRIDGGRYGGELTIGKVNPEFVRYWINREQDELINHVVSLDWQDDEDRDKDSPPIDEDRPDDEFNGWYEIDDYEHLNGSYGDGSFTVHNVSGKDKEEQEAQDWDENYVEVTDAHMLMSRECYAQNEEPEDLEGYVPVLAFHSAEKGGFGSWFIETDKPFDPKKLVFSQVETDLAEIVDTVYYDKEELDCSYDWCDSTGKGYYAYVGWMKEEWWDSPDKSAEWIADAWADYDADMEADE